MKETLLITRMLLLGVIRSRGYVATLAAGVGLIVLSVVLNELAGAEGWRVLIDVGLHFISISTTLIAAGTVLMALTSVEDRQQLQVLGTRPIPREALFMANVLAGWAIALVTVVSLGLLFWGIAALTGAPHAVRVLPAAIVSSVEAIFVVALTGALAAASSRAVAGALTVGFYLVLRIGPAAAELGSAAGTYLRYAPRLDRFSLASWAHDDVVAGDLGFRLAFALVCTVFLVAVGNLRFVSADLARRF